jgi:dipeptidyl aminopeptidase/acylaminoacyl peptidase/broad specificity phosphatase PhoE
LGQLTVVLVRHAQRVGKDDRITPEGAKASAALGTMLREEQPNVTFTAYCSPAGRTRETAEAILRGAGVADPVVHDKQTMLQDVTAASPAFGDAWIILAQRDRDAGVNYYLHFGDTRPDAGTMAPHEAAGRVAHLIVEVLDDPPPRRASDSVCVVMVTHSGVLESFLACMLGFRDVRAIGGVFDSLEMVQCRFVQTSRDETAAISGRLSFRGCEHSLDLARLRALANVSVAASSAPGDDWRLSRREVYPAQASYGFRLAPDGSQLAFVGQRDKRVELTQEHGRGVIRETPVADLCLLPATGGYPRQFSDTGDIHHAAVWSPDGAWLALERGDGLEIRPSAGGAATSISAGTLYHPPVVSGDEYLAEPRWSPDGQFLLVAAREGSATVLRMVSRDGRLRQDLCRVAGYILSWDWSPDGSQIVYVTREDDGWHGAIRLLDLQTGNDRVLTYEDTYEYQKPVAVWADGGACIIARSNISGWSKLWALSPGDDSGKVDVRQLTTGEWDDYAFRLAPDGQQLVFASRARQKGSGDDLWLCGLGGEQPRRLTRQGGVNVPLAWSRDNRVYYWHSSPTEPGDLWVIGVAGKAPTRLTWSAPLDLERKLRAPEEVTIPGEDGSGIPALIYLPAYYQEGERYPAVVWIRGGPVAMCRFDFKPIYNWLANQGYVVITPNYRGSTSYGVAHMLAVSGDGVGAHDVADILATGRYAESLPMVDRRRGVGVGGHSWGGYLTLMAITQAPEMFACAVAGAAIADWRIQQSQTEVRYYDRWLIGGWVYDQPERAWSRSPISGAERIKAPLLVYHGEEDRDVPFAQIGPFVAAAQRAGADVEYVTYPAEGHSNRLPANQQDTLDRIAAFYRRHLQPWNVRDNPSANQVQY